MTARVACALLAAVVAAFPAVASAADSKPPPRPGVLWELYPLGTKRLTGTTETSPAPIRTPLAGTPASGDSSGLSIGLAALGTGAAMLALAGVAALYVRSRRVVHTEAALAGALATVTLAATGLESRRQARGLEDRLPTWDAFTSLLSRRGTTTGQARPGEETEAQGGAQDTGEGRTDVSDQVAEILRAAEQLAQQIRSDAQDEAAQIKAEARVVARRRMRELAREQEALRAAAETHASAVGRAGQNLAAGRKEAEAETLRLVAETEAEAQSVRAQADEMSKRIESSPLRRRAEADDRTRAIESGLRRCQAGLKEISNELTALLEPDRGQPEILLDALDVDQSSGRRDTEEAEARPESG